MSQFRPQQKFQKNNNKKKQLNSNYINPHEDPIERIQQEQREFALKMMKEEREEKAKKEAKYRHQQQQFGKKRLPNSLEEE